MFGSHFTKAKKKEKKVIQQNKESNTEMQKIKANYKNNPFACNEKTVS